MATADALPTGLPRAEASHAIAKKRYFVQGLLAGSVK